MISWLEKRRRSQSLSKGGSNLPMCQHPLLQQDPWNDPGRGLNPPECPTCPHMKKAYLETWEPQRELYEEGFSHSLQAAAHGLRKNCENWMRQNLKEVIPLMLALCTTCG